MSYFFRSYPDFRYPIQDEANAGFRSAQLGAIHSAAAHFAVRKEPAIITMPTGSGKTAVLISTAFTLRAKRVLIITPSRLVREQIANEVATLSTLKLAGALPQEYSPPNVKRVRKRLGSLQDWEDMREYDVIVATVQSISPEYAEIPEPPPDVFDLVLVDEAHHSPARTWQSVLDHFDSAKRILFTATPFRQDQKEIKGRFIFTYDLHSAFRDGIFGQIEFRPVIPQTADNYDEAIARATEEQFLADRDRGYSHRVMVRTDGRSRAKELLQVYERVTRLRLSIITGTNSLTYVRKRLAELRNGDLDGIVCVNMMGEGFDFPSLKIAAVHAPHKSLSVTLQFVGRFARTSGSQLGPATFLAIPSDIEIQATRLYDSGAVWQELIHNLAAIRVSQESETREVLQSFTELNATPDLTDLSLYTLEPFYHVKVFQLDADIDIEQEICFPSRLQVVYRGISLAHSSAVYITRELCLPRWSSDERLSTVDSDLFVLYYDPATKLLFICASRKTPGVYDALVATFSTANPRPLPLSRLNRALLDLTAPEFFNVGMRNRVASNTIESYRISAGPSAGKSVLKSDAKLYHRGHAFGRALENGEAVTIGLSSASKVWSNKSSKLPEFIEWCRNLATKIRSDRIPITNSGLDYLDAGEELEELPEDIIAVDWPVEVYKNPILARFCDAANTNFSAPLNDFKLEIDRSASTREVVMLEHWCPVKS